MNTVGRFPSHLDGFVLATLPIPLVASHTTPRAIFTVDGDGSSLRNSVPCFPSLCSMQAIRCQNLASARHVLSGDGQVRNIGSTLLPFLSPPTCNLTHYLAFIVLRLSVPHGICTHASSGFFRRFREAIECLKRALIGADPFETAIRLRMAGLHKLLGEVPEAALCHNHIVETYSADSAYNFLLICLMTEDWQHPDLLDFPP